MCLDEFPQYPAVGHEEKHPRRPDLQEGVFPEKLKPEGLAQPCALGEEPREEHAATPPQELDVCRREHERQEGEVPDEVLRCDYLLKGHKSKGLHEGAEQGVPIKHGPEHDLHD